MQRLVDAGELTEEEAEQSERRNIILQALGPDPRVKVDLTHRALRRGDTLIICSDGLSGAGAAGGVRRRSCEQQPRARRRCAARSSTSPTSAAGPTTSRWWRRGSTATGLPDAGMRAKASGYTVYHLPDGEPADDEPTTTVRAAPDRRRIRRRRSWRSLWPTARAHCS